MTSSARQPFHVLTKPIGPVCNLRCEYCFYLDKAELFPPQGAHAFRMSDEVLEEYTRQYIEAQHPDAGEINFAWQGGEPTMLGIEFFRKAVALQKKYARPGMHISNALQTNTTLINDEWAAFLKENNFLVGVSIDGPEDLHNRYRKDRHGKGSFDKVMQGIEALRRHGTEFNTLTVVQRSNSEHPQRVYRFLREIGSEFMQFIPIVEVQGPNRVSERSVRPKTWGHFLNGALDEWRQQDIGRIYVQHFELMIGLMMGLPASLCVHGRTCGRSVAIEHNGNLYSCDHFVFPENFLGNVMETDLTTMIDGPKQTKFGNDKFDALPGTCKRCEFLGFCHGGCPSHRNMTSPDGEPGWNYLCEGYKLFFTYSAKYFRAMAECIRRQRPASEYRRLLVDGRAAGGAVGRNDPCPCGSGRKYKKCCGR